MTYVSVANTLYPARIDTKAVDPMWDGRASKNITIAMSYEEAAELFVNNAPWYTVIQPSGYVDRGGETIIPKATTFDNSEFCIAGPITDHRDGTVSIKMGKLTDLEETLAKFYGGDA